LIVLDTNVLVRLITKDDIEQTRQAFAPDEATVASFDERFVKRAKRSARREARVLLVDNLIDEEE